jgi:hypothetical protein
MIKNGTLIACGSRFSFKGLFTKPLHYLIQMVTGSRIEHVCMYLDGQIYQITGAGIQIFTIENWFKEYVKEEAIIYKNEFKNDFTQTQIDAMKDYWLSEFHSAKYSAIYASYSAFDKFIFLSNLNLKSVIKSFCSKICIEAYQKAGFFVGLNASKYSPSELIHFFNESHLTNGRVKITKEDFFSSNFTSFAS